MMPLIISLSTATLFLILAGTIYGATSLTTPTWIPLVFGWLLVSGLTVYMLSTSARR